MMSLVVIGLVKKRRSQKIDSSVLCRLTTEVVDVILNHKKITKDLFNFQFDKSTRRKIRVWYLSLS